MNDEINQVIDQKLRDKIVRKSERRYPASQAPAKSKTSNPARDITPYIARMKRAGETLKAATGHAQEMEQLVTDLKSQRRTLETALGSANRRNAELERALAITQNRAARAQALAIHATKRLQQLDRALADANTRASTFAAAMERAMIDIIEKPRPLALRRGERELQVTICATPLAWNAFKEA